MGLGKILKKVTRAVFEKPIKEIGRGAKKVGQEIARSPGEAAAVAGLVAAPFTGGASLTLALKSAAVGAGVGATVGGVSSKLQGGSFSAGALQGAKLGAGAGFGSAFVAPALAGAATPLTKLGLSQHAATGVASGLGHGTGAYLGTRAVGGSHQEGLMIGGTVGLTSGLFSAAKAADPNLTFGKWAMKSPFAMALPMTAMGLFSARQPGGGGLSPMPSAGQQVAEVPVPELRLAPPSPFRAPPRDEEGLSGAYNREFTPNLGTGYPEPRRIDWARMQRIQRGVAGRSLGTVSL